MSESVTNVEIEDVLSSIRRLMSDGEWPSGEGAANGAAPSPAPRDRLVLAPSLRVDGGCDGPGPLILDTPVAGTVARDVGATPPPPSSRSQLESTIAELEAAIADDDSEWEPDGSEAEPVVDWARATANGAIFGNRASVTRVRDVVEDAEEIGPTIPRSDATRTADHGLADDLGRLDGTAGGSPEETLLDEDALRELVVEIVRQELQGALGERITRNVRKLVRREIYRVISSEDFS